MFKSNKIIFVIIFFFGFFALAGGAEAANWYVRDGAIGSSCNSWGSTAACDALSTAVSIASAGDTIYVASGSYNSTTISKALTIKKATIFDHGSDTDWDNAYAAQATFSGQMSVTTANVTIDGQYRNNNNWADSTAYGFKLTSTGGSEGISTTSNYTTIKYVAIDPGDNGIYILGTSPSYGKLQYSYIYDCGRTNVLGRSMSYWLFEYNYFGKSGLCYPSGCPASCSTCGQHSESFSVFGGSNNFNTIRYNHIIDFNSTGGLMFGDSDYTFVYGNIFRSQYDFANNGVVGSWSGYTSTNWRIYNNTFIDTPDNMWVLTIDSTFTGSIVRNNLFYNNLSEAIGTSGVTLSHNASDGINFGGTDNQTNLIDIFISRVSSNYRLTAGTDTGYTLENETLGGLLHTYNIDPDGNTRGSDGIWDRGAYEYVSGATPYCGDSFCNGTEACSDCPSDCGVCLDITPPAAPVGLTVN